MTSAIVWALLIAPTVLGITAVLALTVMAGQPRRVGGMVRASTRIGVVIALIGAAALVRSGPRTSSIVGWRWVGASIRLDQISILMFSMVALLAVVIVDYCVTYLDGDERRAQFLGWMCSTVACVELLVTADHMALFLGAWIATSLSLHQLLVFYRERPRARIAARKKFVVARVGDLMLLGAIVLLVRHTGTGDMGAIFAAARHGGGATFGAAAILIALAAALKSAQFPTHGWLVEVMETPTPVSAMLHAGILNAGPFLAIRMAPILERGPVATVLLIVVGGTTALFASTVLLTQPSVKVALGYSSAAHMGFMLMVCGLGIYPAAMLHLIAHSFYKAHAFLSSGSVIDEQRASGVSIPARAGRPARMLASVGVALGLYALGAWTFGVDPVHHLGVLVLGAILVLGTSQLVVTALDSDGPAPVVALTVLLAAIVTLSYFSLETAMHHLLGSAVPEASTRGVAHEVAAGLVFASFAGAIALQILAPLRPPGRRRAALHVHLRNGLYANAVLDRAVGALTVQTSSEVI